MNENVRTLYLLRHAHSPMIMHAPDRERTLSNKGQDQAQNLGRMMKEKNYLPDMVLCSSATRTTQTLEGVMSGFTSLKNQFVDSLYGSSRHHILELIQKQDAKIKSLMIVAHNPGIYETALSLCRAETPLTDHLHRGYAPCTLSVVQCTIDDWAFIEPQACELSDFIVQD